MVCSLDMPGSFKALTGWPAGVLFMLFTCQGKVCNNMCGAYLVFLVQLEAIFADILGSEVILLRFDN